MGAHGGLGSLVRLTSYSGLDIILSSRRAYELASLPWQTSRTNPRACSACCLGTQIRQDCTGSSGQMGPSVLLCRQGDPQAVLSVQLPVLWLGFLVRGTESCFIQQWEGLRISIPA